MTQIRPVQPSDIPSILEIYRPFIENTAVSFEYEVPDLPSFTERVNSIASDYPYLVLEEQGKVLGYAYASRHRERAAYNWCVETSIYMADEARGKGLGRKLYNRLLELLIEKGFTIAYGLIALPNESSVALHTKCGFVELAVHKKTGFKNGDWHDVLWMELLLANF